MTERKLTGSCGEHYVCYALAWRGWIASLTRDGLERSDILAVHSESRQMIEVQVKTIRPYGKPSWLLGSKGLVPAKSDHEWYVLVALDSELTNAPHCYVVPRDHVAAATWIVHQSWLTDPSVKVGVRNTPVSLARVQSSVWQRYENRWDLLEQTTDGAPILLPAWLREEAIDPRVGLPPKHPWRENFPDWTD